MGLNMKLKVGKYTSKKGTDIIINKIDKDTNTVWYTIPPVYDKYEAAYYGKTDYYDIIGHFKRYSFRFVAKEWD